MEALGALLVEIVDGVADRLRGASELFCDLGRALPPGRKTHDLGSAEGEGVLGTKRLFERLSFLVSQGSNVYRGWHSSSGNRERTMVMLSFEISKKIR
jgi:hypothetical protein